MIERTVIGRARAQALPFLDRVSLSQQALQAIMVVLGTAVLTFILFLYVLPNSQISDARVHIDELKAEKAALNRRHAEVKREIAQYTDLATLTRRAQDLGMGPPEQYQFLDGDSHQALEAGGQAPVPAVPQQVVAGDRPGVSRTPWARLAALVAQLRDSLAR